METWMPYKVTFEANGKQMEWIRFGPSLSSATLSAVEAVKREYPNGQVIEVQQTFHPSLLIATAPELFEALTRIPCQFEFCNGPDAPYENGITCFRCAAIAKAMGTQ